MSEIVHSPLDILSDLQHPVADLVREFQTQRHDWKVDDWFESRADQYFHEPAFAIDNSVSIGDREFSSDYVSPTPVRLLSVRPYFFRGFRQLEQSIRFDGDLVVIDGKNSSGKTSLAEAIEWLLTGGISRRMNGDPKELSRFVSNRFKTKNEKTWVECELEHSGQRTTLKRTLIEDYGSTRNSVCKTRLSVDGQDVDESISVLDRYFAGVAPLLLQHTLRNFVLEPPAKRPEYFEKLLNVDDISELVENVQISAQHLNDFPRPGGGSALIEWNQLMRFLGDGTVGAVNLHAGMDVESLRGELLSAIVQVAAEHLGAKFEETVDSCIGRIEEMQRRALQDSFPFLQELEPKRNLDTSALLMMSAETLESRFPKA